MSLHLQNIMHIWVILSVFQIRKQVWETKWNNTQRIFWRLIISETWIENVFVNVKKASTVFWQHWNWFLYIRLWNKFLSIKFAFPCKRAFIGSLLIIEKCQKLVQFLGNKVTACETLFICTFINTKLNFDCFMLILSTIYHS